MARFSAAAWRIFGLLVSVLPPCAAMCAEPRAESRNSQQESIHLILTEKSQDWIFTNRRGCMLGFASSAVQQIHDKDGGSLPDASDYCVAVALRMARDGLLLLPYADEVVQHGGGESEARALLVAISNSLMKQKSNHVSVGNGETMEITPAWAFDAGFSSAYLQHDAATSGLPARVTLKPVAERCLAQQEADAALCFSTGYVYGVRAANGMPILP